MHLFTEDSYDAIASVADNATRVYEAANHMASLGLRLFPARPFDGELFESAYEEYVTKRDEAKANGEKFGLRQKHYQQHSGKMPVFDGGQYDKATSALPTIEQWWNPSKGKYRGCNICLATGEASGVVVLDLDVKFKHDGTKEDGHLWWAAVSSKHPEIKTLKVRTGGKTGEGQHIYFRWRHDIPSNRNGFADGVDFRANNGHVMAPFSKCFNTYEVIDFSDVAEMPDWLFDEIFRRSSKTEEFNEEASAPEFDATPLDQIAEMLEYIDPADHEDWWQNICFAIKSEHDSDEGFAVLDDWSQRDAAEYDRDLNYDFWKRGQSKKSGGATISTLYHYAEECGWVNPKKGANYLDVSRAVRMMNRSFAIIDPDRYSLSLIRRGKHFDPSVLPPSWIPPMTMFKTKVMLTDEPIQAVHPYARVTEVATHQIDMMGSNFRVLQTLPNGKTKVASLREAWMVSAARRSYAGAGYYVNDQKCPEGVLNLFPGWAVTPKKGRPEMFIRHISEIICNDDPDRAYWLFNRLAYMVQFGNEIIPTSLVITGMHGVGKSIIGDYLRRMMGILNYKYLHDAEALKTRFSEELVGKFLIVADEAIFSGDPVLRNKLKSMIAADVLRDEGKGKAAKDAQNVMFLLVLSNEDEPVGIEPGDRRFSVFKPNEKWSYENCKNDPELMKMSQKYFKELAEEMAGDGPAHLLHMLMEWDVDKTAARRPMVTEEKNDMAEARLLKTDSLLSYFYQLWSMGYEAEAEDDPNDPGEYWGGKIRTGKFYEEYCDWTKEQKTHHRNSEWKAEPNFRFPARLIAEFGCKVQKPNNKSTVSLPTSDVIKALLVAKLPGLMRAAKLSMEETDF